MQLLQFPRLIKLIAPQNNWLYMWCLWVAILGGCTQPVDSTLRMGLSVAPVDLDPRRATDAASSRINRLLYRRLIEFDTANRPIPGLVTWSEINPTLYRLRLVEDNQDTQVRQFSNGRILTAEDIRATLASILDPTTGSPYLSQLALIKDMQIQGPEQIDIYLKAPDSLFPTRLCLEILPAELLAVEHPFHNKPIGSGPFQLLSWPQSGRLQLVRRSDGQKLELLEVKDPSVRVMKLLRGEINLLQSDLPPELFRLLRSRPGLQVKSVPGNNFTYIGLQMQDPLLSQLPIRQAIAYAIDREAIIRYLLAGGGRLALSLLPPSHWAGATDLPPLVYSPERARQLLAQLGYGPEKPLELSYKTSTDPFRVRLATVIQAQLKKVGIRLQVNSLDWGTFYGDIKDGRFQLYSLTWVGIKTPDHFRAIVHSQSVPPHGSNRGRYSNPQVDTLLDQAAQLPNLASQAIVYRQLQHILLTALPYIPLWYEDQIAVAGTNTHGYAPAGDGNFDALAHTYKDISATTTANKLH